MGLKVVIPAAGGGTRLRPFTDTTPKVLLHVAGKPIIGHILDLVATVNPDEVVVVVGKQRDRIEAYLRADYALNFRFVLQAEPLGLGHAVAQASENCTGRPTLVMLGDTILDLDLRQVVGPDNVVGVRVVDDPRRFGVAELENGLVKSVVEKPAQPTSNLALVGLYYFTDSAPLFSALGELIRNDVRTRGEYQLTDALQLMLRAGIFLKPFTVNHWLDCGTTDTLLETNRYLLRKQETEGTVLIFRDGRMGQSPNKVRNSVMVPPVRIAESAAIENSVVGPDVAIGENATIRNSVVRDAIINAQAVVENAVLEHSILGNGARFLGRAEHVNLGDAATLHRRDTEGAEKREPPIYADGCN